MVLTGEMARDVELDDGGSTTNELISTSEDPGLVGREGIWPPFVARGAG